MKSLSDGKSPLIELRFENRNLSIIFIINAIFAVSEKNAMIFWPAWHESSEIETDTDVVSYMKNAFGGKFRSDNGDGWILSLSADKFVRMNENVLKNR
jgi:hypothetical protein